MTVTDEMHRLLDERGVEYKDRNVFGKHVFHWGKPFHGAMFTDGGEWTELVVENATPEQAIEATLGRLTCRAVEDVLLEACKAYHGLMTESMSDVAHDMPAPSEVIAEYAAKLRELVVDA